MHRAIRLCMLLGVCMFCLGTVRVRGQEPGDTKDVLKEVLTAQRQAWQNAITDVLTQVWMAHSESWTAKGKSNDLEKIYPIGCPDDFQEAYRTYQEAWKKNGHLFVKKSWWSIWGFIIYGDITGMLPGWLGSRWFYSEEQKEATKQINDAWEQIVGVAAHYDVDANALFKHLEQTYKK